MGIKYNGKWYKDQNDLWHSEEGQKIKEEIKKERGYKCEITGLNYGNVEFHHIKPKSLYPHLIFDKKNIIMVIYPLHNLIHKKFSLKRQNKETLTLFIQEYDSGKYDNIDFTTKRYSTLGEKKFHVIKDGFHGNKQAYRIKDRNNKYIMRTTDEERIKILCKTLNIFFNYYEDPSKDIKEWIRNTFRPYYETFYRMVSKF